MRNIFTAAALTLFFAFSAFAQRQAEVMVTSTYLRKTPDYNAEKLQTLQKGDKVIFLQGGSGANGWAYVSNADGTVKGWVLSNTIQTLKNTEKIQNPNPATQKATPTPTPTVNPNVSPSPTPEATPETPENDNEVLKIDTEEVSLNVRVINNSNRPVGNLKESAFKVYEDGVLQPITSVSVAEVPIFNALVIDNSRSLRSQLAKVVEAGKIIVGTNKPQDEAAVVRFVSGDKIQVVQEFTSNKAMIDNALDNLFVEGGQTAIIDAVYRAAEMVQKYQNSQKKEDVKLRTLILVTDGDDRGSDFTEKLLFELLRNSYVQIYAIGFTNNLSDTPDAETGISRRQKAQAFLTRLAQETGGKVYFPDSIEQLGKIALEISSELRTQYVVSYAPTNDKRDGSFRKIKVEVTDDANKEKRTAITRSGRNAAVDK
ncbi:MAG TPA: VWA domain-containing protein [Pyrinomonadaceae bacterium]|nr:VWA domain-containing protein [Pyrinomonadaceae bacterium]